MKKAIFPGSFDPFTRGHLDILNRAIQIFDEVVVCIGVNSSKKRHFSEELMINKILTAVHNDPRVKVMTYSGLTANFAKSIDAKYIVRGLRNSTDLEYESTISQANKHLWDELETVFFITDPSLSYISSTIVRELHKYKVDLDKFLPYKLEE